MITDEGGVETPGREWSKKKKQTEKKLDVWVEKDFTLGPDRAETSSNM